MIELEKSEYPVLKNLFSDDHPYVEVPMIINDRRGRAWVDSKLNPRLGLIAMGDMAFIEGDGETRYLKPVIKEISSSVIEICCDLKFKSVITETLDNASENQNIFFFHDGKIRQFRKPSEIKVVEIDEKLFDRLHETGENWLGSMFNNGDDFVSKGFGYGIIADGILVGAAVTFGVDKNRVNIGVGTHPDFRLKGFSTFCTCACVNKAYERRLKPIWITGPTNLASKAVAIKNGFTQSFELPNFWLGPNV